MRNSENFKIHMYGAGVFTTDSRLLSPLATYWTMATLDYTSYGTNTFKSVVYADFTMHFVRRRYFLNMYAMINETHRKTLN